MNRTNSRTSWVALLFVAAAVRTADAQDMRLNILKEDSYVLRKMVVFKTSGERINTVVKISSYDQATRVFVVEGVTGETTSIPASEIQKIEFEQTVKKQSPMAQEGHWEVRATPGSKLKYKVDQSALSVASEELILPASSSSSNITGPRVPASERLPHVDVVEARTLTVDGPSRSFIIEVQNVRYTREMSGGSGMSGTRK